MIMILRRSGSLWSRTSRGIGIARQVPREFLAAFPIGNATLPNSLSIDRAPKTAGFRWRERQQQYGRLRW